MDAILHGMPDPVFFGKILSAREQTVLAMLSDQMTDPEIAEILNVSPRTVESHRMNIRRINFLDLTRLSFAVGNSRKLVDG